MKALQMSMSWVSFGLEDRADISSLTRDSEIPDGKEPL